MVINSQLAQLKTHHFGLWYCWPSTRRCLSVPHNYVHPTAEKVQNAAFFPHNVTDAACSKCEFFLFQTALLIHSDQTSRGKRVTKRSQWSCSWSCERCCLRQIWKWKFTTFSQNCPSQKKNNISKLTVELVTAEWQRFNLTCLLISTLLTVMPLLHNSTAHYHAV